MRKAKPKGFDYQTALRVMRPELAEPLTLWSDRPHRMVWPVRNEDELDNLLDDPEAAVWLMGFNSTTQEPTT